MIKQLELPGHVSNVKYEELRIVTERIYII